MSPKETAIIVHNLARCLLAAEDNKRFQRVIHMVNLENCIRNGIKLLEFVNMLMIRAKPARAAKAGNEIMKTDQPAARGRIAR